MVNEKKKDLTLDLIFARHEDLSILLDLEKRNLAGMKLDVRQTITLRSLREFYPGSSSRIIQELIVGEKNEEDILLFTYYTEDTEDNPLRIEDTAEEEACRQEVKTGKPPDISGGP